ncbi:hypothetical protein [Novosphingobium mangrovi (ex Huang et al. 2023)]|uniref:Uncharacterized protein n=1 Tax=Novosphingobium mangrovi (ex Huang et al. 2023) TaxID=2976432 RepID=A0ABT2I788_9SPHN|nr:hypothetical protein [Novosphingobium mangrovi (ex Huang et al. 2023)]MCT2400407.1 hypothetical protein [Novosphingobium mangrovi (ex Huang et al. 2023)]
MGYLAKIIAISAFFALPAMASGKDNIPANVTVATNRTVEKIDWSFPTDTPVEFSRVKRCVATNLHNDEVQLRDSAGSWVGPATGNYYQRDNRATVQGGGIFKVVDDQSQYLVAQGQTDKTMGLSGWIMRFDLEAAVEQSQVVLVMRNVKLAAGNTGSMGNDGFQPLGTWFRFKSNYAALETVASALKSCISE